MKQFSIDRTDEETFAILYCGTPYPLTIRVNLLSQMNPLAELLQCDSRLIRYAWDSRLVPLSQKMSQKVAGAAVRESGSGAIPK